MLHRSSAHAPTQGPSVPKRGHGRRLAALAVTIVIVGGSLAGAGPLPAAADSTTTTAQRLFTSADQPRTEKVSSKRAVNLGVKFKSSQPGTITALQFYRGPGQLKAYKGSLWSKAGKLLARVTFPKSSSPGWQAAALSKPVTIRKNVTYVASYLASDGRYPRTTGAFSKAYSHDDLTVPKKGGLYRYSGSNRFPTKTTTINYLVDVEFVPSASALSSAAALTAVSNVRVFFGHQSVGGNIISGLAADYQDAGVTAPPIVGSRVAPTTAGPVFQHAYIGTNGNPVGKMKDFANLVNGGIGAAVDVALMKLCFVDFNTSTDPKAVFDEYTATMSALEKAYPKVTFLYTTAPVTTQDGARAVDPASIGTLTGSGTTASQNVVRERYNTLVRAKYAATGRLFDIAALEARRDDGTVMAGSDNGTNFYVMNPDLTSDGGHLNDKGARQVALALAQLIAQARS